MSTTTTFHPAIDAANFDAKPAKGSVTTKFTNWCSNQQQNRLLWLAIALAGQGCVITPITIMGGMWNGINMTIYSLAIVAIVMNVIVNLAALPTKITIPVLFLSILIDVMILGNALF